MKLLIPLHLFLIVEILSHSTDKREIVFQEVVRQRSLGNNGITQCPCVMHPESRHCIAYDSRYQASTIEEAILTFPDLTHSGNSFILPVNSATFNCQSTECQQCFGLLYYRLIEIGFLPSGYRPHIFVPPRNQLNPAYCLRLRFSIPPIIPPPPTTTDAVRRLISDGLRFMQSGGLRLPSRQSFNRDRFRPGPPPSDNRGGQRTQQHQQNQAPNWQQGGNNWQQPTQQPQTRQWQQQRQPFQPQGGQNTGQQVMENVWNAAARRWEQRPRIQLPNVTPRPRFPQPPNQWIQPRPQIPQQWNGQWRPQIQQTPIVQPQIQQPQWIAQQPQVLQPQVQVQSNQQLQTPQWQWPQVQPQIPEQQQVQWPGVDHQIGQALQQSHQVINPVSQLANWGAQQGQGQGQGPGQGGTGGGSQISGSVTGGLIGGLFGRKKREITDDPVIGRRFTIACVRRGETTADDGEFLSLCGSCWTWRQLPEDYFPRILNELSCQEDDYCISGWGQCKQQFRNVDVLRRVDGRWVPTVITTSTCCDCRVKAGTEIHALVIGDRQRTE